MIWTHVRLDPTLVSERLGLPIGEIYTVSIERADPDEGSGGEWVVQFLIKLKGDL